MNVFEQLEKIEADINQVSKIVFDELKQSLKDFQPTNLNEKNLDGAFKKLTIPRTQGIYLIAINDNAVYIGKSNVINTRLREHLVKKSKTTSSKLEDVKNALKTKQNVSIAWYETKLSVILENSILEYDLAWNKRKG